MQQSKVIQHNSPSAPTPATDALKEHILDDPLSHRVTGTIWIRSNIRQTARGAVEIHTRSQSLEAFKQDWSNFVVPKWPDFNRPLHNVHSSEPAPRQFGGRPAHPWMGGRLVLQAAQGLPKQREFEIPTSLVQDVACNSMGPICPHVPPPAHTRTKVHFSNKLAFHGFSNYGTALSLSNLGMDNKFPKQHQESNDYTLSSWTSSPACPGKKILVCIGTSGPTGRMQFLGDHCRVSLCSGSQICCSALAGACSRASTCLPHDVDHVDVSQNGTHEEEEGQQ